MVNRNRATLLPLMLIIGLFVLTGTSNSTEAAPAVAKPAKAAAKTKPAKQPVAKPKAVAAIENEDKINLVYGDIVMDKTREGMEEGEVEAVVFPHWFHRIRFRCKVCHEDTFKTDRGSNDVNMDNISAGEQCGICHDGAVAWDPLECELCHMYPMEQLDADAAPPPEEKNPANLLFAGRSGKMAGKGDRRKPSGSAFKWGAGWQPRAFSMAGLPKDKYGLVDWIKITQNGMLLPKGSIDPDNPLYESPVHYIFDEDGEEDIEDIVIPVKSKTIAQVLFPHTLHAWWLNCKSCHPHRFVRTAGDTKMTMREMAKGKYCGECHGKVAFPLEDCEKCHNREKVAACKKSENCTFD